jgi:Major Facilitator Superfamily
MMLASLPLGRWQKACVPKKRPASSRPIARRIEHQNPCPGGKHGPARRLYTHRWSGARRDRSSWIAAWDRHRGGHRRQGLRLRRVDQLHSRGRGQGGHPGALEPTAQAPSGSKALPESKSGRTILLPAEAFSAHRYALAQRYASFVALTAAILPWQRTSLPSSQSVDRPATPTFAAILSQRALWGAALGHFAANYTYYFIIAWLPFYLVKVRGFSITEMAATASWAYLLNAPSALAMGALTDRWLRAGRDPTSVYKPVMGLAQLGSFGCMTAMVLLPPTGSVAALLAFEVIAGCSYPGLFAIPQTFAGPDATGRWVGVQNASGNVAGMIAPVVTGLLVDRTGGFDAAFVLAAGVSALGFAGWVWVLPRVAPIDWSRTSKTEMTDRGVGT